MATRSVEHQLIVDAVEGKQRSRRKKTYVNCPLCPTRYGSPNRTRSCVFYWGSGFYKCFRCKSIGVVDGWATGMVQPRELTPSAAAQSEPEKEPIVLEGFYAFADEVMRTSMTAREPLAYLHSRGVTDDTIREVGIGMCIEGELRDRIVVPLVDHRGELWGAVGRTWLPGQRLPYRTLAGMDRGRLFNEAAIYRETADPVLVVEGVFDALPYWPEAVACLGKPNEPQIRRLLKAQRPVAVCLDGDAWREGKALALRLWAEGKHAGFVRLPGGSDPNKLDPDWLRGEARACIGEAR